MTTHSQKPPRELTLDKINFPVFKCRDIKRVEEEDGIIYVHTYYKTYTLDNKNLKGNSMGERRLRIKNKENPLYPFKNVYKGPRDLLLKSKAGDILVDSSGKFFKYSKKVKTTVLCFKIKSLKRLEDSSKAILYYEDFPVPSVVSRSFLPPEKELNYVTMFKYNDNYFIYSLEKERVKPFTLKI